MPSTKVTQGMGRVFKKCDPKDTGRCRDGGSVKTCRHGWTYRWFDQRLHYETFSTKALAEDKQAQVWRDKRAGEQTFTRKGRGAELFVTYCAEWIERGQLRGESTKVIYRSVLRKVAPKLEGRTLAWVADHPREITDLIVSFKTAPDAQSYVRSARLVIVGCVNTAVKDKDIPSHSLRGLDIGKDVRVAPADFYAADHAELSCLAAEIGDQYGLLVWLGRYAGLRIGESLGVRADDIVTDIDGGKTLVLRRQRMANGTLAYPKAREAHDPPRRIPVSPFLAAKLSAAATDPEGYYFPPEWRPTVMDKWNKARNRTDLPRTFTPHALRHIFASDLLSKGARLDLVSKILGHQSVEITSKVYAHAMPSDFGTIRALLAA
jgi:integrase